MASYSERVTKRSDQRYRSELEMRFKKELNPTGKGPLQWLSVNKIETASLNRLPLRRIGIYEGMVVLYPVSVPHIVYCKSVSAECCS